MSTTDLEKQISIKFYQTLFLMLFENVIYHGTLERLPDPQS